MAAFRLPVNSFDEAADAWIARRRSTGSAMLLARLASIIVTWLFISVLPGSRNETGTPAISDFFGTLPRSSK